MNGTHCVVIDTNVLCVAEGLHAGASEACRLACVQLAGRILEGQRVGVDTADAILNEYMGSLRLARTDGVGKKLAVRLFHLRFNQAICHRVDITPADPPPGSFAEVPALLADFDVDDHKFLAVAAAEGESPPIYAALDGEWWERRPDFAAAGLDVQFVCGADML
jgi:hypothetical protein